MREKETYGKAFLSSAHQQQLLGRKRKKGGKCDFSSSLFLLSPSSFSLSLVKVNYSMLKPGPHQQRLLNVTIFLNANADVNESSNDTQMQLKLHMDPTFHYTTPPRSSTGSSALTCLLSSDSLHFLRATPLPSFFFLL